MAWSTGPERQSYVLRPRTESTTEAPRSTITRALTDETSRAQTATRGHQPDPLVLSSGTAVLVPSY